MKSSQVWCLQDDNTESSRTCRRSRYKTMDGTVVTIPVVADLQAELDLAESLNRP